MTMTELQYIVERLDRLQARLRITLSLLVGLVVFEVLGAFYEAYQQDNRSNPHPNLTANRLVLQSPDGKRHFTAHVTNDVAGWWLTDDDGKEIAVWQSSYADDAMIGLNGTAQPIGKNRGTP